MKDFSTKYNDQLSYAKAGGKACGASYISAGYVCRVGGVPQIYDVLDTDPKGSPLNEQQLAVMEYQYEKAIKNGNNLEFPFKMPVAYDDASGAPEAITELTNMRSVLKQDKKTGTITIPKNIEVSDKARQLVDEWNGLERDSAGRIEVFTQYKVGTFLNVGGLGTMGGPRDSVPKDAVRGLVQYTALRRQDAKMADTPTGQRIVSYRDPFTGTPRPFAAEDGKILASQDHWSKPFSIYGIKSENDVKNTVYMPASMNSAKETKTPVRYSYDELARAKAIPGGLAKLERNVVDGFNGKRYAADGKDFLPKGVTRASENKQMKETSNWMVDYSRGQVTNKYMPQIRSKLEAGKLNTYEAGAKQLFSISKQRSDGNYYGWVEKTATRKVWNATERKLFKGIGVNTVDSNYAKKKDIIAKITANMRGTGKSPEGVIAMVLAAREANQN